MYEPPLEEPQGSQDNRIVPYVNNTKSKRIRWGKAQTRVFPSVVEQPDDEALENQEEFFDPEQEYQIPAVPEFMLTLVPKDENVWDKYDWGLAGIRNSGNTCFFAASIQMLMSMNEFRLYLSMFNAVSLLQTIGPNSPTKIKMINSSCTEDEKTNGVAFLATFQILGVNYALNKGGQVNLDKINVQNETVQTVLSRLSNIQVGDTGDVDEFLNKFFDTLTCLCPVADNNFKHFYLSFHVYHYPLQENTGWTFQHILRIANDKVQTNRTVQEMLNEYCTDNVLGFHPVNRYLFLKIRERETQHSITLSKSLTVKNYLNNNNVETYRVKGAIRFPYQGHFVFVQFDQDGNAIQIYDDAQVYRPGEDYEDNVAIVLYEKVTNQLPVILPPVPPPSPPPVPVPPPVAWPQPVPRPPTGPQPPVGETLPRPHTLTRGNPNPLYPVATAQPKTLWDKIKKNASGISNAIKKTSDAMHGQNSSDDSKLNTPLGEERVG
jgi:hypothetical protein